VSGCVKNSVKLFWLLCPKEQIMKIFTFLLKRGEERYKLDTIWDDASRHVHMNFLL